VRCDIIDLGISDYSDSLNYQKQILEKRFLSAIPDTLIFVQHEPVITLGIKGGEQNILQPLKDLQKKGIEVIKTDRGGDVTYHGPGQIVAWPIFDLKNIGKDIHKYLRMLEETVILLLNDYKINADRLDGFTGVWAGEDKISSVGVGIRKWVSYHGISLNVSTSLEHLGLIHPCGLKNRRSTTMANISGKEFDIDKIKDSWQDKFKTVFDLEFTEIEKVP